mgnify:CR=1 FL=1
MNYYFDVESFAKNASIFPAPLAKSIKEIISSSQKFETKSDYQKFLNQIISAVKENSPKGISTPLFNKEILPINKETPLTEKVIWGGVSLKNVDVDKDFIQKLLVVQKYGILGFEIHKQKLEKLRVLEGKCIVLYSNHNTSGWEKGKITIKAAQRGNTFEFQPNDEHGIIAISNCVIEETSTNHLDDLTFIFQASQV